MFEEQFHDLQDKIQQIIGPYQQLCDLRLRQMFNGDGFLDQVADYSLNAPGKRLRSVLHLLMVEAMGGDSEKALPGALSYEMAHTASLVHDDIIDNAAMRRGKDPVFRQFGLDAAIVSGDALLVRAFQMIEEFRHTDLSREDLLELVSCTARMGLKACRGQLMDSSMGRNPHGNSIKDYLEMISSKTASLIEGPCECAAIIAGRKEWRTSAALFGRYLGIAFQILDDSKDIYSCESSTLKGRFTDIINNKPNIYVIWSLKRTDPEQKQKLLRIISSTSLSQRDIEFLYNLLHESGVLKKVIRLYRFYLTRADKAISFLPDNSGKTKLKRIISSMASWPDE